MARKATPKHNPWRTLARHWTLQFGLTVSGIVFALCLHPVVTGGTVQMELGGKAPPFRDLSGSLGSSGRFLARDGINHVDTPFNHSRSVLSFQIQGSRQRLHLRGGQDDEDEDDRPPVDSVRMKAAIEKLEEMKAKDEAEKAVKEAKERELMRKAEEAARKIPYGFTVGGEEGVWLPEEEKRNKTATDQFQDPIYGVGWANFEDRPIPVPHALQQGNLSRTELLSRDELGWRLDDGSLAPQYGNAIGHMGFGTRSVGFDPVAAGHLYTNESYDPEGAWRAEDEAFVAKIRQERAAFGDDWYRYLPEDREEYEKLQAIERGETDLAYEWELLDAAWEGNNIKLREMMAKGATCDAVDERVEDLEHRDATGRYAAMHYAAMGGHRRTLEWLRAYGALHSPRNSQQETPLHLAAAGSWTECVRALLDMGADPNAEDCCQWTPLFKACFYAAENATVEALVNAGADINHLDMYNRSVLDVVTQHNQTEQMEVLVGLGSLPAHVPGAYTGSAAERVGAIKEGSYVTLTDDFCNVFDLPKKQAALDAGALPLSNVFDREDPFYTFLDTVEISERQRRKIELSFSDGHDGPLLRGMLCRVVEVNWHKKSDGRRFVPNPYCIEISFGNDPAMLRRWGVLQEDSDSDPEEEEEEGGGGGGEEEEVWEEGSADHIRWWYSQHSLRLARPEEVEAWRREKRGDAMADDDAS